MNRTDLSRFNNSSYRPGSRLKIALWYITSNAIFLNRLIPSMGLKRGLLKAFGASIGKGLIIKPKVNIKYPWKLTIGDHVWIGEEVWIDNLDEVYLGDHVCLSQGAMLLSGNHDYSSVTFDLMTAPIRIEDGAWIGAKAVVVQGRTCGSHSVLTVGSVCTTDMDPYVIYQGNPATRVRERNMNSV